jgi:hypothetical protein
MTDAERIQAMETQISFLTAALEREHMRMLLFELAVGEIVRLGTRVLSAEKAATE